MKTMEAFGDLRVAKYEAGRMPFWVFTKVLAMSLVLTLVCASTALADTVTNLLDNTPEASQLEEVRVNEGQTRSVPFRVLEDSEKYPPEDDGENGCNIDAGEVLEVGFNSNNSGVARTDPAGSRISFADGADPGNTACGPDPNASVDPPAPAPDDRPVTVRGVSRGTANITVATPPARNTTGRGFYFYGPAALRVVVQNVAPTANGNTYTTNEDNVLTVGAPGVLGNDTDPGNNPLTAVLVNPPQNGTIRLNADGSFAYTPNGNFSGTDTFTYRASDGQAESNTTTVTINVAPVNDRPNAAPDTAETGEDQPAVLNVLDNDTDAEGNSLVLTSTTQPANGTVGCTPVGVCTYVPNADFNGVDTFTYRANDDIDYSNVATVVIEVAPANDPPVAENDRKTVAEDETLNFPASDLVQNDSAGPGENGQSLTVTRVDNPKNGTVRLEGGRVIFEPDPDFNGTAGFTYTVCDSGDPRGCDTDIVDVEVGAVNDPPTARDDEASVPEDGSGVIPVLANGTDVDGGEGDLIPASVRVVEGPSNGRAVADPLTGKITYTPNENFDGSDSFTYEVCDDQGACSRATVGVTVGASNDPPIARDDGGSTGTAAVVANSYISQYASQKATSPTRLYRPDTTSSPYKFGKIGGDIPRPLNALGYRSTDDALYGYRTVGTRGIVRVDPSTGAARFLGNPRGLPTGSYIAGDVSPKGSTYYLYAQNSGILRVVDLANRRAKSVKLSSRVDVADLAVSPTNGRLYGVANSGALIEVDPGRGRVTSRYLPELKSGRYGAAWFTTSGDLIAYENGRAATRTRGTLYQIQDPTTTPAVVDQESGPYTAGNDGAAFVSPPNPAGLAVGLNVLENDTDPDNALDPDSVSVVTPPAFGTTRVNPDGTITYTSNEDYRGIDSFRYRVCDVGPDPWCSEATVNITAAPTADAASSARRE